MAWRQPERAMSAMTRRSSMGNRRIQTLGDGEGPDREPDFCALRRLGRDSDCSRDWVYEPRRRSERGSFRLELASRHLSVLPARPARAERSGSHIRDWSRRRERRSTLSARHVHGRVECPRRGRQHRDATGGRPWIRCRYGSVDLRVVALPAARSRPNVCRTIDHFRSFDEESPC